MRMILTCITSIAHADPGRKFPLIAFLCSTRRISALNYFLNRPNLKCTEHAVEVVLYTTLSLAMLQ